LDQGSPWKKYKKNFGEQRSSIGLYLLVSIVYAVIGLAYKNGLERVTNYYDVLAGALLAVFAVCIPIFYTLKPKQKVFTRIDIFTTICFGGAQITTFFSFVFSWSFLSPAFC
jgi:hypothetical protein